MSNIDIKAYTRKVKDLEVAIYTQKNIMKEHEIIIGKNSPSIPHIISPTPPKAPDVKDYFKNSPYEHELNLSHTKYLIVLIASIFFIGGFCILVNGNVDGAQGVGILMMSASVLVPLGIFKYASLISNDMDKWRKECSDKFSDARKEYNTKMEEHRKLVADQEDIIMSEYIERLKKYNQETSMILNRHKQNLISSEKALDELYAENIIFPKYRNLVAITMINEYLESGRCNELEGANGAYNLYEMELRQNIVIGQLSNIIGNLEQIRNNQYSLYEELKKSNQLVNDIIFELQELNATAKLDTYFNYVTALAETSPKIYHGITY